MSSKIRWNIWGRAGTYIYPVQVFQMFGGVSEFNCFQQVPTGSTPAMPSAGYLDKFKDKVKYLERGVKSSSPYMGSVQNFQMFGRGVWISNSVLLVKYLEGGATDISVQYKFFKCLGGVPSRTLEAASHLPSSLYREWSSHTCCPVKSSLKIQTPPSKKWKFVLGLLIARTISTPLQIFHRKTWKSHLVITLQLQVIEVPIRGHGGGGSGVASGDLLKAIDIQIPPQKIWKFVRGPYMVHTPLQTFHQKYEIRYSDTPPNISNICTGQIYLPPPPPNIS